MAPTFPQDVARFLTIGGYAILLWRVWRTRLNRTYKCFAVYLIARLLRAAALATVQAGTNTYAWVWMASQPVLWVLYVLVVLELYSLVLKDYRGVATLGRWTLMVTLGASVLLSVISLVPDLSNPAERYPVLLSFFVIQRGLSLSLAIFLLLITVFLVWYPVPLNRNVIIHSITFSVYFLSVTMAFFVRNVVGYEVMKAVNMVLSLTTLAALLGWIIFLSPAGERKTVVLRYRWRPEDEERIVQQLSAINNTLLRVARK